MSQENVEVVKATLEAWNAGDMDASRQIWHGAGQGPEANMEMTVVFTVRKGRILSLEAFWDHAETLETLGLSE